MNFIVWLWEIKKMLPWDIPKHSMQEYEDEFHQYCSLNNVKIKPIYVKSEKGIDI